VSEHVVFAGEVPDDELPGHYAAGDVFAFVPRERHRGLEVEAFGIVVIQAAGVGVAVVGGRTGGVPDAVGAPEAGVLVDATDDAQVLEAIAGLLADEGRRRALARAGAERVARDFTWPARTVELRALLASVSRSAGGASRGVAG
jgi:phosphatidylinositol alpha-1,6-mannosyltransferase